MSPSPPVTVVLLTYKRGEELVRCLRSLLAQDYRPLQIVVVDDGSGDETPEIARRALADAPEGIEWRVEEHERNRGIGPARNTGIAAATGEFIAFTDDDCVARPDWVTELVRPFDGAPDIAVTGGGIDEPEDPTWVQRAAEGISFLGTTERDVVSCVGCNMAYRASFLAEHPFDPTAQYADELDRCFRAAAEGFRVRFVPKARVTHYHRRTLRAFLRQQYMRGQGSVWVRRKHGGNFWPVKNWGTLLFLLGVAALAVFPGRWGAAAAVAGTAIWVAMIFYLDLSRGKSPAVTIATLPLLALGYLSEFAGATSRAVRGAG